MAKSSVIDIDHGYKDFVKAMKRLQAGPSVKVGFLDGKGDQRTDGGPTNVELAIWAEFGTRTEPERSFMRSTFDEHRDEYRELGEKLSVAVAAGKMTERQALGILGERVTADIRKKILSNVPPPNAPSTIAAKGHERTLVGGRVATSTHSAEQGGQMAAALTYEVDANGEGGE